MNLRSDGVDVLLIEDDRFKEDLVTRQVTETRPQARIVVARSVQQGVRFLREQLYDVVLLDMALPSHENRAGGTQPISQLSGGIEILLELSYDGRSDPVVILTQYPDIEFNGKFHLLDKARKALNAELGANVIDVILFNAQENSWRDSLKKALP
jgi:CheY-like chemotaxis protein